MYNYYEFNKYDEDGFAMDIFNGLSTEKLKSILNDNFNEIEYFLDLFANTFKSMFNGDDYDEFYYQSKLINYANVFKEIFESKDYDEFYYSCLSLVEELNDIKIIISILKERDKNV